jgi:hypothetical protein
METSKEKAKELVDKYSKIEVTILGCGEANPCVITGKIGQIAAKECAKIAVQEIINNNCGSHTDEANATKSEIYCDKYFWKDVLEEIDNV